MKSRRRIILLGFVGVFFFSNVASALDRPQRVVSMSPHYTILLYDLGAQDLLVGVTDFCRYPPAAQKKEKVGGFLDSNIEKIIQLQPDLVLMLPSQAAKSAVLKKAGIRVLILSNESWKDIWTAYDRVGRALGMEKEARIAKGRLQARLSDLRRKSSKRKPVTALFVVGKDPGVLRNLLATGPGTFLDESMAWAGIRNILADSKIRYPLVSKEELVRRDPDLIFQVPLEGKRSEAREAAELKSWESWKFLKAVDRRRVFIIPRSEWLVPGPAMVGLVEFMESQAEKIR